MWDENKHPREPKGSEKGGQFKSNAADPRTYRQNASYAEIMAESYTSEVAPTAASRFYNAAVSNNPTFVEIEKEALAYIGDETVDTERASGKRDDILAAIVTDKQWGGSPQRLSDEELAFSLTKKNGTFLYRGLSESSYKKAFYEGDLWIGRGFFGNGIYMAYDALEASGYGNNIAVVIIDDDMHLAPKDHKTEYNAFLRYLTDKISIIQRQGTIAELDCYENLYQMMKSDYGKYVALSGYEAYKAGKNIVVLNRSKLKIGETNERLERIALKNT